MNKIFFAILISLATLLPISPIFAQPEQGKNEVAITQEVQQPDLTSKKLKADLAAIESSTTIDDAVKAILRPKYTKAIGAIEDAERYRQATAGFLKALKTGSETTKRFREELKDLPSADAAAKTTPPFDDSELKTEIAAQNIALSSKKERLAKVNDALIKIKVRPAELSKRQPIANSRLDELRQKLLSPEYAEDAASLKRVADRLELQSEIASLESELEMLKQEQLSLAIREEALQAEEDLLTREVQNATAELDTFKNELAQRLSTEAATIHARVAELTKDLSSDDQRVGALVAEARDLADQLVVLVGNLSAAKAERNRVTGRLNQLQKEYEEIDAQLEFGDSGGAIAQFLLDLQRRCFDSRDQLRSSGLPTLDQAQLATLDARKELRGQNDLENEFANSSSDQVVELVELRGEMLEKLRAQSSNLARELALLDGDLASFSGRIHEVLAYIDEKLFWLKSSDAINVQTIEDIPAGLSWVFQGKHWLELRDNAVEAWNRAWIAMIAALLAMGTLLVLRPRIVKALIETGVKTRRISTDHFRYTIEALAWTLLLAVPIPLMFGIAAWAVSQTSNPSGWSRGLTEGLWLATLIASLNSFIIEALRDGGLADKHFRWKQDSLPHERRVNARFSLVFVPAIILTFCCIYEETSLRSFDSVGRIGVLLANAWIMVTLWALFAGSKGVMAKLAKTAPTHLVTRSRYLWFSLLLAIPLTLIVLACLGYLITAFQMTIKVYVSWFIFDVGMLFYLLTIRWFAIKHRRLALAAALERRQSRQQEAEQSSEEVIVVGAEDEEDLDLESVGGQTQTMIRFVFGMLIAGFCILYWSTVIPLLSYFETIPIPLIDGVTLLDLLQVILVILVTVVVVRNLPGLLELAVLRTTRLEAGTRFAITQISKYCIIAASISTVFNLVNVDWAKFGWIAAALSVGLGFGLQEIVANFICGIILLFERPIRVGDVVTIENTTGTVTNINMRATTITNWDRQEFVVPNKNLITGTILNWTLNGGLNRIMVNVGVAYGSDLAVARQILLDVAQANPKIVEEPSPLATFEEFGESSLNLVLRAYLPSLDGRLQAITDLNSEIDRRFAEAGIEIAFPQQDVHFRDDLRIAEREVGKANHGPTTESQELNLKSAAPETVVPVTAAPQTAGRSAVDPESNRKKSEPVRQAK